MPVWTYAGKLSFSTRNSYRPIGRRANRNAPVASDLVDCVKPVSAFVAVTRASGTTAPLWSDTLPPKLAVVYCAKSGTLQQRKQAKKAIGFLVIMRSSPWRVLALEWDSMPAVRSCQMRVRGCGFEWKGF